MFRNYFITALRNIIRQKGYSLINILGLATGLACTFLILLWVQDELSYDRFHEHTDRLYRVEENQHYSGSVYHVNVTPYPSGPVWKEEIPEIEDVCRHQWPPGMMFRYGENAFNETGTVAVDPSFLTMFSFPLISGDINTALSEPHNAVLTEETAKKYFGEEDPIGKFLNVNNQYEFTVTGIIEDPPGNSILDFDILIPFEYLKETDWYSDHWGSNSIRTFLLLHEHAIIDSVNSKLTRIYKQHLEGGTTDFMVASFPEIHLHQYWGYNESPGAIVYVYIFSVIAIFVLLIACINFMNLTTACSANRTREIGLRKVAGAFRKNIIGQFLGESILLAFISLLFALVIILLVLPKFNEISGKELTIDHFLNARFIAGFVLVTLLTGFIAGSYPSLYLSAFRPIAVMKGKLSLGSKSGKLRKILVVFQFTLSVGLAIGSIIIFNQLGFMKSKDLGFNPENLVYIYMRGNISESYPTLKDELLKDPLILGVTASNHQPHRIGSNSGNADWEGKDPDLELLIGIQRASFDYVKTLGINIARGRDFSPDNPADLATDSTCRFLINEELARIMNVEDPVNNRFQFMGREGTIIGVMEDWHYQSARYKIEPLAIAVFPPGWLPFMTIRISPDEAAESLKAIENTWKKVVPDYPLEYQFVDEDLDRMYRAEARMSTLMKYFTIMALIIACLGLYGLASYTSRQRTREIGIRKVMGARVAAMIVLLLREFTFLVLISCLLGSVAAWFIMDRWLLNFAYPVSLSWWIFVLTSLSALVIATVTVSYQAIKAALTNPAETLRYE